MSQQGPILVVSTARRPSFAATLDLARLFPVVETEWAEAMRAVEQVQPAAVLAATSDTDGAGLAELAGAPVVLASTNERALEAIPLSRLQEHAVDVPADPGSLA